MLKSFYNHYKKQTVCKYFYRPDVTERCTAYGQSVADEFNEWCKYFAETWNTRGVNFLLNAAGNIDGNPIRGDARYGKIRKLQAKQVPEAIKSCLPPLYFKDSFFEVDANGYLYLNGQRQFKVGKELKAWAVMTPDDQNTNDSLLVIGKMNGNDTFLAAYQLGDSISDKPYATIKLPPTLNASTLMCFGRHVFVSHDARLSYFYYSPQSKLFENVPIGDFDGNADKEFCNRVGSSIVTDGSRVYWISNEDVFGINIGAPHQLLKFDLEKSSTTTRLQCFDNSLYVYRQLNGRQDCVRFDLKDGAKRSVFSDNATMHVFVSKDSRSMRVFRVTSDSEIVDITFNNEQNQAATLQLNTKQLFCLDTAVCEARYLAYGADGEILAIK